MSITNALSNAVSGMSAASRRADVTAHNIANATTEGYARQTVDTIHSVAGGRGDGVRIAPTARNTDAPLTASRREAEGQANGSQAQATAARTIADTFSGSGALFDRIAALENSLRGVSETPESVALQERVVANAGQVADAFATVSDTIQSERTTADKAIGTAVDAVNAALKEIESLNGAISAGSIGGFSTAAYEQQRDAQLDIVSGHMSIRLMSRDNGQVAVLTDKGVTLLDNTARTLEFEPSTVVTADMDHRAGIGPLSGLSVDGIEIAPQSGNQATDSGLIAGLFETRDGTLADANTDIDTLAAEMIDRFEAAGIAGADGRGLFTDAGSALSSPAQPGLAGRIALNERVDSAQGGAAWRIRDGLDAATQGASANSSHVTLMLNAMTEARSPGGSLSRPASMAGLAGDMGSLFETRGQSLENGAAGDITRFTTLETAESNVIGVDLDQELQNLILIEQAYGANAKVIQVADRLVQRLLEI